MPDALHITPIENLAQIVERGGLWCDNHLRRVPRAEVISVTAREIKDKRANRHIPELPGRTIGDYVPFHLTWRTRAHWQMRQSGRTLVILVIDTTNFFEWDCLYTDRHPLADGVQWWHSLRSLPRVVDLDLITSESPMDHPQERRVFWDAEVLIPTTVRLKQFTAFAVRSKNDRKTVIRTLRGSVPRPRRCVVVRPEWFDPS